MAEDLESGQGMDGDRDAALAVQMVMTAPFPMVLTDPHQKDNPIIFVNRAFERATGYRAADAIGRNCRFLQGDDVDPKTVAKIRAAVEAGEEVTADILNHRYDGSPFWNRLMIAPLKDADGSPRYFFGVQKVLSAFEAPEGEEASVDTMLREIQHRVKNHLMMVVSLIRLQSRDEISVEGFDKLARRVESLQLLYEELNASGGESRNAVALGGYLSRIVNSIAELQGGGSILVDYDIASFTVPLEAAVHAGMIVSEAATNAIQHAFEGRENGRIRLSVRESEAGDVTVKVDDDGNGMTEGAEWPDPNTQGGRIILQLAKQMGGSLTMESSDAGSVVTLTIPAAARDI